MWHKSGKGATREQRGAIEKDYSIEEVSIEGGSKYQNTMHENTIMKPTAWYVNF